MDGDMKTTLAILLSMVTSPAAAQEATKALVNMYVAQDFCGLSAPDALVRDLAPKSAAETGMSADDLVYSLQQASRVIGNDYAQKGTLVIFCRNVEAVYYMVRGGR